MDKQASALGNLALMRDQKTVFYTVRTILDTDQTDAEKVAELVRLYEVFDSEHPA